MKKTLVKSVVFSPQKQRSKSYCTCILTARIIVDAVAVAGLAVIILKMVRVF